MEIIYFNPSKGIQGKSLLDIIGLYKNPEDNISVFDTIDVFTKKLMGIKGRDTIAVIFAAKEDDLIDLYSYKYYLYKVISLLILPNSRKEIIALGLRYNPFFIISNYDDMRKIGLIIRVLTSNTYDNKDIYSKRGFKYAA
jgi:hypothetical protein